MKPWFFPTLLVGLAACGGAQNNTTGNITASTPGQPVGFQLTRVVFQNQTESGDPPFGQLSLDGAGNVALNNEVIAHFVDHRLLDKNNFELCHFDDRSVTVDWKPELSLHIRADGTLENRNGGTLRINDLGVIVTEGPNAMTGEVHPARERAGHFVDFKSELRVTHSMLYVAFGLYVVHEIQLALEQERNRPPPVPAQLRFVHLFNDPAAGHLQVSLPNRPSDGGVALVAFPDLAYGTRTAFFANSPGSELYDFGTPGSATALLHASTPALESGKSYLGVVHAPLGAEATPMLTVVEESAVPSIPEGQTMVQWFNAITGTTAIDLCLPGPRSRDPATAVFQSVNSGTWAALEGTDGVFATLASAASGVKLQVRATDTEHGACKGTVLGTITLPADVANHAYRFFTLGKVGGPAALQLLSCPVGDETCTMIPVQAASTRRGR